jgi:hypothetical protein
VKGRAGETWEPSNQVTLISLLSIECQCATRDCASARHAWCAPAGMCCAIDRSVRRLNACLCSKSHLPIAWRSACRLIFVQFVPRAELIVSRNLLEILSSKLCKNLCWLSICYLHQGEREKPIWRIAYYSLRALRIELQTYYCRIILLLHVLTTLV